MKKLFNLTLFLSFFVSCPKLHAQVSLEDAIDQNLVEWEIKGESRSPHYVRPLVIRLENPKKKPITIFAEAGTYFISNPPEFQDLLLAKSFEIMIPGKEVAVIRAYAFCTESHNSCPQNDVEYTISEPPNPDLVDLAQFIEKNRYYGKSVAQSAVWLVADNSELSRQNLGGSSNDLRNFLIELTGQEISSQAPDGYYSFQDNEEYFTEYNNPAVSEITGQFTMQMPFDGWVRVGMFNTQGILVREIYDNPNCRRGEHTFSFSFDANYYTEAEYLFKILIEEEVVLESTLRTR